MIKFIRNLPINRKLLLILFFSSVSSLLFAGVLLIVLEISELQRNTRDDLSTLAQIVGNRSTAALMFEDRVLAKENLSVLDNLPDVRLACLYDAQDAVFAQLIKQVGESWHCPPSLKAEATRFEKNYLHIVQPVAVDGAVLGTVYIYADLTLAYWRRVEFSGWILLLLAGVSILTFFLSTPLLTLISSPIKKLVDKVENISATKDYSLRAVKVNDDELGVLVDAFNGLIATVETQNRALTQAKNRYLALYDDNPTMVFNLEVDGRILSVNRTGAGHLGVAVDELQHCSIFDFVHADDLPVMLDLFERCLMNPAQVHKQEIRKVCENGRIIWVRESAKLVANENRQNSLLMVGEDITEARLLHEKIVYQASHDALTGLDNRGQFDSYIRQAAALSHTDGSEHALCYLDLDQFKVVNDTCGHVAGDELLRQLGELLRKHTRKHDFVARLGGDEFGILMNHCSLNEAFQACENLRDLVKDFRFAWEDRSFTVGVSIGIAAINGSSGNAVNLLKEADAACYAAKDKGRNRVHVFRPDDEELAIRHGEMQWVDKIQQGLEQNRFCLYGQPIVSIAGDDEGMHFETLVRYRDDNGHIIPPGAFLPAAERYNQAAALDRWVISRLFEWLATKPGFLDKLSLCSVNLSGLSLSDETMLAFISGQFSKWAVPAEKICFEVTETAAIANLSHATNFINQLKEQGCLFSLDDFGSGLSSFAYLKNLPVDFLKIDGLFVKDILDDKVDLAMVKSINEVGHVMGKKTIAEFVENEHIFNLLNVLGVNYAQGYGIGKPVPLDELMLVKPYSGALK
ncbi:EAL domain-containing protein [Candidatus Methylobacter oryzae]|uniref:EAL domain-containing protein n=1 Tax=Candidatus Methylobacter oryzae TaxID=2497749 RepID=A0ABY3CDI5_9GAMM|nr:EAL domain-containing protein [Candidatus Methylobacter oryzae]TRX00723.1 EAL domain-containing protein [Candidatus Methylobacter oryzae]